MSANKGVQEFVSDYCYLFNNNSLNGFNINNFQDIIKKINISNQTNSKESKYAKQELSNILPIYYLNHLEQDILIKNNETIIDFYKDNVRKSGKLFVEHPISVEHILLSLNLPIHVVIAGLKHDNIEEKITKVKKELKNLNKDSLDDLANSFIEQEHDMIFEGVNLSRYNIDNLDKRLKLYSTLILKKVTRFEKDENYYISIDKLFDKEINYNLVDLSEKEISDIIISSAIVKLADRVSNSLDFESRQIVDQIRDIYKNMIVINGVNEYIRKNSDNDKSDEFYDNMIYLKKVLVYVNDLRLRDLGASDPISKKTNYCNDFISFCDNIMKKNNGLIGMLNDETDNEELRRINQGVKLEILSELLDLNSLYNEYPDFTFDFGFYKKQIVFTK